MSYDVETIANAFLRIAREDKSSISHMKMQKLLYFAQGHALSLLNKTLIQDDCQAWDYGPVFPNLYRSLRRYGASEITEEIVDMHNPCRFEPKLTAEEDYLLREVWKKYGSLGAIHLSALSHATNGPWEQTRRSESNNKQGVIPKPLIKSYFNDLATD